jgi:hypothetical protein
MRVEENNNPPKVIIAEKFFELATGVEESGLLKFTAL